MIFRRQPPWPERSTAAVSSCRLRAPSPHRRRRLQPRPMPAVCHPRAPSDPREASTLTRCPVWQHDTDTTDTSETTRATSRGASSPPMVRRGSTVLWLAEWNCLALAATLHMARTAAKVEGRNTHATLFSSAQNRPGDPCCLGRSSSSGHLLQQHLDRRSGALLLEAVEVEACRHLVRAVQRRCIGHLHASLDAIGLDLARIDQALEPTR